MSFCTICGDSCPGIPEEEENVVCADCYQNNLAGNQLAQPSCVTWDRGRGDTGAYIVYDASQCPPLLLEAVRLEHAQTHGLAEVIALCESPPPLFIPYEPRHMIQAIVSVEEARALLIAQADRGREPASSDPEARRPLP